MKRFWVGLLLLQLVGCENPFKPALVQHAGPFKVVTSIFDLHETLAYPDGREFEFRHSNFVDALSEEGETVEIEFTGDLNSNDFDNNVISVKVLEHSPDYIKHHPELWPPRNGHWDKNTYLLDDGTGRICGKVDDDRSINEGWQADADYPVARELIYQSYVSRADAVRVVEHACR